MDIGPYAPSHLFHRRMRRGDPRMLCEVIMKTEVECVTADESVVNVARRMRRLNIGFMPVCDKSGKVLGTVTDRDIVVRMVADELPSETPVQDIMSSGAVCCGAQDDVGRAQELMARHRISRIVCVDEAGRLEGIISLSDLAQLDDSRTPQTLQQISSREARQQRPA